MDRWGPSLLGRLRSCWGGQAPICVGSLGTLEHPGWAYLDPRSMQNDCCCWWLWAIMLRTFGVQATMNHCIGRIMITKGLV